MAPEPSRIYTVAEDLLDAVATRHGGSLPDRQYVSAGPPAWDCELLAVWCERTYGYEGNVAGEVLQPLRPSAGHTMRAGTFGVMVVRCTPAIPDGDGTMPSVDDEQAAASVLYEDAQRVLNALVAAEKAGEVAGCHSLVFENWTTLGPEGGMVAGLLRVRVGLVVG